MQNSAKYSEVSIGAIMCLTVRQVSEKKPAAHKGAAGYGSCGWFGIWEFFPKAIANTPYGMCVKLLYEENTMSVPSTALSTSIRVNPSVVLS